MLARIVFVVAAVVVSLVATKQSVRVYEPEAVDLLSQLGLTVSWEASSEEGSASDNVVPTEGVQALSAAMSLIAGESGASADVSRPCCISVHIENCSYSTMVANDISEGACG